MKWPRVGRWQTREKVYQLKWILAAQALQAEITQENKPTVARFSFKNFLKLILVRERKGEREKHQFAVPLIHAFTDGFLHVP